MVERTDRVMGGKVGFDKRVITDLVGHAVSTVWYLTLCAV
jgi:hypothetical protein